MKYLVLITVTFFCLGCHSIKNRKMKKEFNFYTEYRQFYIEDDGHSGDTGSPNFWNENAFKERLALMDGIIGVGTQSYGNIKGEVELLEKPNNNIDYSKYDHIVEGGINIQSGKIQIVNCPDNNLELTLNIPSRKYRVRVYSSNLNSVKDYDLPQDTDNDYYRIEIWPSEEMGRKVLKQYEQGY